MGSKERCPLSEIICFQSFNFRSKSKLRSFYSLVANITAEELNQVELVSMVCLNNGPPEPEEDADISEAPFEEMKDIRLAASFLSNGGGAMPINSNGNSWNMDFVTTTGNVIMDLLHNFHLECGARLHKLRVYETLYANPIGNNPSDVNDCADQCRGNAGKGQRTNDHADDGAGNADGKRILGSLRQRIAAQDKRVAATPERKACHHEPCQY